MIFVQLCNRKLKIDMPSVIPAKAGIYACPATPKNRAPSVSAGFPYSLSRRRHGDVILQYVIARSVATRQSQPLNRKPVLSNIEGS